MATRLAIREQQLETWVAIIQECRNSGMKIKDWLAESNISKDQYYYLYRCHVIQADETPLLVNKDSRPTGSKSYMWIYRTGKYQTDRQVILYDYQKTRKADHPMEFLKDFRGVCVTDGYQVYHTLEGEPEVLVISGCWAHSRRRYDEAVKVLPKSEQKMSLAY